MTLDMAVAVDEYIDVVAERDDESVDDDMDDDDSPLLPPPWPSGAACSSP